MLDKQEQGKGLSRVEEGALVSKKTLDSSTVSHTATWEQALVPALVLTISVDVRWAESMLWASLTLFCLAGILPIVIRSS